MGERNTACINKVEEKNILKINRKERDHLEDLGIDWGTVRKSTF